MTRAPGLFILIVCAASAAFGQTSVSPLELQIGYFAHDSQSGDGDAAKLQPIDHPDMQIANVTGFSWKVVGSLTGYPAALVRVKWYRGPVELLNGVLVLPEQLGADAAFSVAPAAGLYRVEVWVSLRPEQPEERAASVAFEVKPAPIDAAEPFESLREVVRQKEEVWRWKEMGVRFYTVARYLPSCNLGRIRLAMLEIEPLIGEAANQWREYYASRVEKLNDEQNRDPGRLQRAQDELGVLQRTLKDLNKEIQKAKDSRDVLVQNGLVTAKSDEYLKALEGEDLPALTKAIDAKKEQIADIVAEQTQDALDIANAQRDLNHVDSDATFDKDQLIQQLGQYDRQCRPSAQAVPQKVN
jgi:hypothetical protein